MPSMDFRRAHSPDRGWLSLQAVRSTARLGLFHTTRLAAVSARAPDRLNKLLPIASPRYQEHEDPCPRGTSGPQQYLSALRIPCSKELCGQGRDAHDGICDVKDGTAANKIA
jgi:hypothetical protein